MKRIRKTKKHWLWALLCTCLMLLGNIVYYTDAQADSDLTQQKIAIPNEVTVPKEVVPAEIHFIDTGNSDAILIRQGEHAALIDGGDNDDEQFVVNYIRDLGIKELDMVFNTHPHADHVGGLDAVLENIKVNQLYISNGSVDTKTYRDFLEAAMEKGLQPSVPLLNSQFKLGTITLEVISAAHSKDPNDTSLVLLMTNGNDTALFMGDAEEGVEAALDLDPVDLLKVGHHGSASSSSRDFLEMVDPQYAVTMVGLNNKYGHPHKETMSSLQEMAIPTYRTDENGTIIFKSTGNGFETSSQVGSYTPGKRKK